MRERAKILVLQLMDALVEKSRLDLSNHRRARTRCWLIYKVDFQSSLRVNGKSNSSKGCNLIAS
jgi:hypothetical protein